MLRLAWSFGVELQLKSIGEKSYRKYIRYDLICWIDVSFQLVFGWLLHLKSLAAEWVLAMFTQGR